jgi:hypothetical protein
VGLIGITCVNGGLDSCMELMLVNTFTISVIYAILLHLAELEFGSASYVSNDCGTSKEREIACQFAIILTNWPVLDELVSLMG